MNGAQAAYDAWRSFCPPVRAENADLYSGEPYVMPGNVAGPQAATPGQAGWTWYTGTAAWYLRALVEGVLGVKAHIQGLRVRASLPDDWDSFRIKRPFRGAVYEITVQRGEQPGTYVNGTPWQGDLLPPAEPDSIQIVNITI